MEIQITEKNSVPVLVLEGRLDAVGARDLDSRAADIPESRCYAIINMGRVNYISSVGIRSLLKIEKNMRSRGGRSILCALSGDAMSAISMSGLDRSVTMYDTPDEALKHVLSEKLAIDTRSEFSSGGREYTYMEFPESQCILELWGRSENSPETEKSIEKLFLDEIPLGVGIAGFSGSDGTEAAPGEFIAAHHIAGAIAADGNSVADYFIAEDSSKLEIDAVSMLGINGKPCAEIKFAEQKILPIHEAVKDFFSAAEKSSDKKPERIAFCAYCESKKLFASHFEDSDDFSAGHRITQPVTPAAAFVVGIAERRESVKEPLFPALDEYAAGDGIYVRMNALFLNKFDTENLDKTHNEIIRDIADLERLGGVGNISPDSDIGRFAAWLFVPEDVRPGTHKRIKIEFEGESDFPEEFNIIIRRIYGDSGKVVLKPLTGGFSARTFLVNSFDRDGRRQLPTVLKIASKEAIRREENAYSNFVKKFILNNSTSVMGRTSYRDYAGLRYNFVGIGGADSRIEWLEKHFQERPAEEVAEIFDRVFTHVLKPWYGQPRMTPVRLYDEHYPGRLFSTICEDAKSELGIDSSDEMIHCPCLGRSVRNPFHFLKNEFPKRKNQEITGYKSVIHGDLNMKNILLDEDENIYVIDFSETRESNIVSDFARLEPIIKFEMLPIDSDEEIAHVIEFEQGLLMQNLISELPRFTCASDDPAYEKAYVIISKLRNYADRTTIFERDMRPYLLAMLEWTLPIASYMGFPIMRKKAAAFCAALIVEKIIELDQRS
ncbi:MAG: STAS domain-containing protein [Candidatus Kapaibacterium sp.]